MVLLTRASTTRLLRALLPRRPDGRRTGRGRDLVRRGRHRLHATTQGLQRVDVIYRRIDDDFLDPAGFRPDSMLGVPGLMNVYRSGSVTIANAPGHRHRRRQGDLHLCPGDDPLLPRRGSRSCNNVPTCSCADNEDLRLCARQLTELVVKEVHGSGGYGMLIGPTVDQRRDRRVSPPSSSAAPGNYIAQPTLALSTCPTFVEARHRAAPCRPAPVRAWWARDRPRARRADAGGAEARARWWSTRPRAAAPRTPGCWRT